MVDDNPKKGVTGNNDPNEDGEIALRGRVADAIALGGGVTVMAAKTGVPTGTLSKYTAKTSTASFANAAKIAAAAGIPLDSIAFGGGELSTAFYASALRRSIERVSDAADRRGFGVDDLDQPGMVSIPLYDEVRPSAGPGSTATSETPTTRVAFERHWLAEIGVQTDSAVILPAQGDSMEPTIMNGSPMLVDTSKTEVQNGYIYVIAVENDLLVKRVRRRLDGRIDLISDNRAYDPETLDTASLQQLRVIGRVYAAVSKF